MAERSIYQQIYSRIAGGVAFVSVQSPSGDQAIGSAFHIGDGIFVTARHVLEGRQVLEVATTKSTRLEKTHPEENALLDNEDMIVKPRTLSIIEGPFFGPPELDVAVFRVELAGSQLPTIDVSQNTVYDMAENDLELSDVLIVGYPPIPFTTIPYQIVTLGQINAVIRVRHSPIVHMIVSAMARGGFSGGVAVDKTGMAIGLVTESLGRDQPLVETGYMSLLSIEAAVDLAIEVFGFAENLRHWDHLIGIKLARTKTLALSTSVADAEIFVYDDDRDIFALIKCDDLSILQGATDAFAAVVPVAKEEHFSTSSQWHLEIVDNPSASMLVSAAEAAQRFLEESGYKTLSCQRSTWQVRKLP